MRMPPSEAEPLEVLVVLGGNRDRESVLDEPPVPEARAGAVSHRDARDEEEDRDRDPHAEATGEQQEDQRERKRLRHEAERLPGPPSRPRQVTLDPQPELRGEGAADQVVQPAGRRWPARPRGGRRNGISP